MSNQECFANQPWFFHMDHTEEQSLSQHQSMPLTEVMVPNEPAELDSYVAHPDMELSPPSNEWEEDAVSDIVNSMAHAGIEDCHPTDHEVDDITRQLYDRGDLLAPVEHTNDSFHFPSIDTLQIYSPLTDEITIEERRQKRRHCLARLQRGIPHHDPFSEWSNVLSGMYGQILPTEFYLDSPPFTPWSIRGRARIRFIRDELSMPLLTTATEIEGFLSRNLSIIRHLMFNTVAHPDWSLEHDFIRYELKVSDNAALERNRNLLQAIQEVSWRDEGIRSVLQMITRRTRRDLWKLSAELRKVRRGKLSPDVYNRARAEDVEFARIEEANRLYIMEQRRARPYSLLRNIVTLEDIPEEEEVL